MVLTVVGLSCDDDKQLIPLELELLRDSISTSTRHVAFTKLCAHYPKAAEGGGGALQGWDGLTDIYTTQYILPADSAAGTTGVRLRSTDGSAFNVIYQDLELMSEAGAATLNYPPKSSFVGAPLHLTLTPLESSGDQLQAVWVSFRAPPEAYDCARYDHCCRIDTDIGASGVSDGTCELNTPSWRCEGPDGDAWVEGREVGAISFLGALAGSRMADGGSVLLHLNTVPSVQHASAHHGAFPLHAGAPALGGHCRLERAALELDGDASGQRQRRVPIAVHQAEGRTDYGPARRARREPMLPLGVSQI